MVLDPQSTASDAVWTARMDGVTLGSRAEDFAIEDLVQLDEQDLTFLTAEVDRFAATEQRQKEQGAVVNVVKIEPNQMLSKSEKARIKARKFYHRRVNTIKQLRAEVSSLEEAIELLSLTKRSTSGSLSLQLLRDLEALDNLSPIVQGRSTQLERLRHLIQIQAQLQQENAQLRRLRQQSQHQLQLVRDILHADDKLYIANSESFTLVRPLTVGDCVNIRNEAIREYQVLDSKQQFVKTTDMAYGWNEKRVIENGVVSFSLHKMIYHHSAAFIFNQTWRLISDPVGIVSMYSNTLDMRCHVVQKVDENNIVFFHESMVPGDEHAHVIIKSIYLVTRFRTEAGFVALICSLGPDRYDIIDRRRRDESITEVWSDLFACIKSEVSGDKKEHCSSSYAGTMPIFGADSSFWSSEIALHVLRWEAAVLGPRFSLPA